MLNSRVVLLGLAPYLNGAVEWALWLPGIHGHDSLSGAAGGYGGYT